MSSILVRGLHAPSRCSCCFLAGECLWACTTISRYCPISDFPDKHGRLVDADALAESVMQAAGTRGNEEWILDLIEEAETIVEAREVSDNGWSDYSWNGDAKKMAGLIIRGMAMPKSCDECRLFNECWCMALGIDDWRKSYNKPPQGERLPDCPLVPLPAGHGRIVDAAEVIEKAKNSAWFDGDVSELGLLLGSEVTTIVPAEGGGEDG